MLYANRVLIPIANPDTAHELLELGCHLAHPEQGKIYALYVTVSDNHLYSDSLPQLIEIVKRYGGKVELVERVAISVARGILDAVRELNADLVILGFKLAPDDPHTLSPTIKAVAEVAPSPLLIYRSASKHPVKQILVPIRPNAHARVALTQAQLLASSYQVPVKALYVQRDPFQSYADSSAQLHAAMAHLPETARQQIQGKVVYGSDVVAEIVQQTDAHTLVVLGFTEDKRRNQWLFGDIPQRVLAQVVSPVILVERAVDQATLFQRFQRSLWRFTPVMTVEEQTTVFQNVQEIARFSTNYATLLILSATLASLGLLQNSAAVIIGAMLVAPLMSPLMGFGLGMAQNKFPLIQRSFLTVAAGVLIALLFSFMVGLIIPLKVPTAEMLARGQPTLIDMGVALASGVVAAFAIGRKDIPAAIAGVAIAAALMPPVCTTGLALAFGEWDLFTGAGLLFILNLASISVAAFGTFLWMGFQPVKPQRRYRVLALITVILLAVPMSFAFVEVTTQAQQRVIIQQTLESSFPTWDVLEIEMRHSTPLLITATLRGEGLLLRRDMTVVEQRLEANLDQDVTLEILLLRLITPPEAEPTGEPETP